MNQKRTLVLLLAVFVFANFSIYSQDEKIPVDTAITIGTLNNGLKYYILKNKKPENRAELRLVVNVGSVLEDDNQKGLAHFVEHMAFNGTEHFKKNELVNFLESIGIKFGADLNASTGFDETVYKLQLPTDKAGIIDSCFIVLEDWAKGLTFDDEEIDKERGVITEEWRVRRDADSRMQDKQFPVIFKGSKYAERLPIGDMDIIKSFEHPLIKKFYKDWYRPDLMAVIAVGDFDKNEIETLIKKHFENISNPSNERKREFSIVPPNKETLFAVASDKEATGSDVSLYMKHPIEKTVTLNDYRKDIINQLCVRMINARLNELTQLADPPFIQGYAGKGHFVRTVDVNVVSAMVKDNGVEKALETILREVERVDRFGFTATELDRNKTKILRGLEKNLAEKDKIESVTFISELVNNYFKDSPLTSIQEDYDLYKKYIPGITLEEVNKAASELILPDNRIVVVSVPEKEGVKIPTEESLKEVLSKVQNEKITPYVDKVKNVPLVKTLPNPSKIKEEKNYDKIGITEWKLENGAKVLFKKTDFKNDEILFSAFSYGGNSLVSDDDYISSMFSTQISNESGLGEFDKIELQKALSGKVARVNCGISKTVESIDGSCSPKDETTMFQLLYLYFNAPRFDSVATVSYKAKMKAYLENMRNEPQVVFNDTLARVLYNYNKRAIPVTPEVLDKVDFRVSEKIFKERFGDISDFTFFFVGNIDTAVFKPLVLQYIGGLPGKNSNEEFKDLHVENPKGIVERNVYKGLDPKSDVVYIYTGDFNFDRAEKYNVESLIDALNIRLREVVREDKSGTYGINTGLSASKYPQGRYMINMHFSCNPARVEELCKAAVAVLDSMKQFGPSEEIVKKIKETQKRTYEVSIKQNAFWKSSIIDYLVTKDDPNIILDYPKWNEKLTAADIKNAAAKYLGNNCLKAVLYPEKSK